MAKVKAKNNKTILKTDSTVRSYAKKIKPTIIVVLMFTLLFVGLFFYMDKTTTDMNNKNNELINEIDDIREEIKNKDSEILNKDKEIQDLKDKITFNPENLLALTNEKRKEIGARTLTLNSKLNDSAKLKAQDMYDRSYWAHDAPDGTEPWRFFDRARYTYSKAGENLAFGFKTGDNMMIGWMISPEHKENMLDNSFREVGFSTIFINEIHEKFTKHLTVAHYGTL